MATSEIIINDNNKNNNDDDDYDNYSIRQRHTEATAEKYLILTKLREKIISRFLEEGRIEVY